MRLSVIAFFLGLCCQSQQITVLTSDTGKPVPYANCVFSKDLEKSFGGYCDANGVYKLPGNKVFDKIRITCVGYETLEVNQSVFDDTLLLKPAVYRLPEVVISKPTIKKYSELGFYQSKKKAEIGAPKGFVMCVYIANPYREAKQISSFQFRIKNLGKAKLGFRLHSYNLDSISKLPTTERLIDDIVIISDNSKRENLLIDVEKFNISLPREGTFIGIEWLGVFNENTSSFEDTVVLNGAIYLNDSETENLTYFGNALDNSIWVSALSFKKSFEEYSPFKNTPNASFGITIIE